MYFKDIEEPVNNFLKIVDYRSLFANVKSEHNFVRYPTNNALTLYGLNWFKKRKIFLRNYVKVFRMVKNFQCTIHVDSYNKKGAEFAFNFVYSGNGEMQWVDNIKGEYLLINNQGDIYPIYQNIKSFDIVEKWVGSAGLVKTDTFHRVVTEHEERYCLSFRTIPGTFPRTFEEASNLI